MKTKISLITAGIALAFICFIIIHAEAQPSGRPVTKDSLEISQAIQMIQSPDPVFQPIQNQKIDPSYFADLGFEQVYANTTQTFKMRDGKNLFAFMYPKQESKTTIILLHGVLSSSYLMNKTAGLLREAMNAEVIALDFRGHGQSEGKAGDVDYIDQYADDLADVISLVKKEKPNTKLILAGHSMGGGIALRYAMKSDAPAIDGYLLLAPLLGHNSPTIPTAQKNESSEEFLKIHIQRLIGLKILNAHGDHRFDNLPVLFFNVPKEMPIHNYSYRANESMAPDDYKSGLGQVKKPLLVLVGSKDEAFVASAFKPAVMDNSKGDIFIVEGATHNGIRHHKEAMQRITEWAKKNKLTE